MYTLLKPIQVREKLLKRGFKIFSAQEFRRIFHASPHAAKYFLESQVHRGFLLRLKRGIYSLKTDPPTEEEIANALYKPSYISFEYALAYYQVLPEMPYAVTSATTKPTRLFTTSTLSFSYRTIKKAAYTGYVLQKKEHKSFLIAEKEKALVDHLYFVSLRKSPEYERLFNALEHEKHYRTEGFDKKKAKTYARLFESRRLQHLLNSML